MTAPRHLLADEPTSGVRRLTLIRPQQMVGMRAAIRAGTEIQALAVHQRASLNYRQELQQGVTRALSKRDAPFGDYRTTSREETS